MARRRAPSISWLPPTTPVEPEIGYMPGAEDTRALIRLEEQARWVAEYFPVEVVSDGDEGLVVRFSASDPSVIARLLLRLGRTSELLEGDSVAKTLSDLKRRVLVRYGEPNSLG